MGRYREKIFESGFYNLIITAINKAGEEDKSHSVKFYVWDWSSFITGIDATLGILGDLLLIVDTMIVFGLDVARQAILIAVSLGLLIALMLIYNPGYTWYFGGMFGCLIGSIMVGAMIAANKIFHNPSNASLLLLARAVFLAKTDIHLILTLVTAAGDIINGIIISLWLIKQWYDENNDDPMTDWSQIIVNAGFNSYDVILGGFTTYGLALFADASLARFLPIELYVNPHLMIIAGGGITSLLLGLFFYISFHETLEWFYE